MHTVNLHPSTVEINFKPLPSHAWMGQQFWGDSSRSEGWVCDCFPVRITGWGKNQQKTVVVNTTQIQYSNSHWTHVLSYIIWGKHLWTRIQIWAKECMRAWSSHERDDHALMHSCACFGLKSCWGDWGSDGHLLLHGGFLTRMPQSCNATGTQRPVQQRKCIRKM